MRVLVFGRTGQLGQELARAAWPDGVEVVQLGRSEADFSRPQMLPAVLHSHRPDVAVIAAAYTAVDRAESEPELAMTVNADAPAAIATAAAESGAAVIHVSTDYVFDGTGPAPYRESDPVAPLGAYGRSKEAGERAVRASGASHTILRTAWVYSPFGTNFVRTMLRLAEAREEVGIVTDQHGCPTAAGDLAAVIVRLCELRATGGGLEGTFHAAGGAESSWHGFAEAVFAELARRGLRRPRNRAIATSDYPTPARRPANSRLDSAKLAAASGLRLPPYTTSLPRVLDELLRAPATT